MVEMRNRFDLPAPGGVAWLDVTAESPGAAGGRVRIGPLGLKILPLTGGRGPYFFKGARLRGTRCIWSASTVSGAELCRGSRAMASVSPEPYVHLLARADCAGSVFDPVGTPAGAVLRVLDPAADVNEQFPANAHVYTLNVPHAATGLEAGAVSGMVGKSFELTRLQADLLRSAVSLLVVGREELTTPSRLLGVDRYLGSLAGLLLRTAVERTPPDYEPAESIRARVDMIIFEQAADPMLTPASIAAQLNTSLRQLYRAFNGAESPAARIRRRRLERAAELLASRPARPHVEQVATQCGFASAEYFSRAFRREFGLSPRAYRSAHKGQ